MTGPRALMTRGKSTGNKVLDRALKTSIAKKMNIISELGKINRCDKERTLF